MNAPKKPRSLKDRFDEKWIPEPFSGCWLWTAYLNKRGYGQFQTEDKPQLAHRMAWTLYNGKIPPGLYVLHKCDTPSCVNPKHLFVGNQQNNLDDACRKGRVAIGEKNGGCKLTAEQVKAIRKDGRSYREIADDYGISMGSVSNVKSRVTWRHIPEQKAASR